MCAKGQTRTHALQQRDLYSITSSARVSKLDGSSRPSSLAALALRTNSIFVICCTGNSAARSPCNATSIGSDKPIALAEIWPVAGKPASRHVLAKRVDRGHAILRGQRDNRGSIVVENGVPRHIKRAAVVPGHRFERTGEILAAVRDLGDGSNS